MLYEFDKETIDFLCKHKITATQYLICLLAYKKDAATIIRLNKEVSNIGGARLPAGTNSEGKTLWKKEIDDLVTKGLLAYDFVKGQEAHMDNYKVTKLFTDEVIDPLARAGQEFFNVYPRSLYINGAEIPARGCDEDDLQISYLKAIKGSIKRHKEVIAKFTAYRESGNVYAKMNIMKAIGAKIWEDMEVSVVKSKLV